ncbi:MAG: type II toxin-antitoxin system RelE/ParE family toxin [Thermoproteales archaeon]|nr:type II toxin-antitoxin system RelE/ParE family toxin [Thermoproteales archaeon]RLE65416.1 MAG: type II toxin-antitoxin system RelE/ParE family toxin [Thermoprotei archaeon]
MFRVELSSRAFKALKKLEPRIRHRILKKLEVLKGEPLPRGVVKLRGEKDVYRLRIGDYRVLYKVFWEEKVVLVFKIDHRRTVYK